MLVGSDVIMVYKTPFVLAAKFLQNLVDLLNSFVQFIVVSASSQTRNGYRNTFMVNHALDDNDLIRTLARNIRVSKAVSSNMDNY